MRLGMVLIGVSALALAGCPARQQVIPANLRDHVPVPADLHGKGMDSLERGGDTCQAGTDINSQKRTEMKHRGPSPAAAQVVAVGGMIDWDPPAHADDAAVRQSQEPIADRESAVFEVEGDVWRGKIEGNDCDVHVELSAPGGTAASDRVIVEIPAGPAFDDARNAVMEAIGCRGGGLCVADKSYDLPQPVRIRFRGLAFWDGAHYTAANPKKGHSHGTDRVATLWELHPAWSAEVLGSP